MILRFYLGTICFVASMIFFMYIVCFELLGEMCELVNNSSTIANIKQQANALAEQTVSHM
jgi:hypothetical protein